MQLSVLDNKKLKAITTHTTTKTNYHYYMSMVKIEWQIDIIESKISLSCKLTLKGKINLWVFLA